MTTSRWQHAGLFALLAATAALYLWHLSINGYGNDFYAAAAQAGAQSWSAWFYGALDARNFITVDKPPAALWITGLSVRLFGMNPWSVLVPEALMGVAAVAVLYATVRRSFSGRPYAPVAGLLAGAVLAVTPAAALMFRFNNPDALLVLLLVVAAYCLTRAVESASWRWLVAAGAVLGTAFLTKMLQGFLVLPAFGLTYLLLAPASWRRRLYHLLAAGGALVVAAGWWVLTVQLVPPSDRPYIGGSTDDTELDLALGYNGISRIVGGEHHAGARYGHGLARLFTAEVGNEIGWLLPAAVAAAGFGLYLAARHRLPRTELAALVMWTGWLVTTSVVLGYMNGMLHPYYTVSLAPAIGALLGCGVVWAWRGRARLDARIALAVLASTAALSGINLLHRNMIGPTWLVWAITAVAVLAAIGLIVGHRVAVPGLVLAAVGGLIPVTGFAVATVTTPHRGTQPVTVNQSSGWLGDLAENHELAAMLAATRTTWSAATNGSQPAAALEIASGTAVMAVGGWSGDPVPTLPQFIDDVHAGRITYYVEAGHRLHGEVIRAPNRTNAHTREIADWVAAHYTPVPMGSSTVYRLI